MSAAKALLSLRVRDILARAFGIVGAQQNVEIGKADRGLIETIKRGTDQARLIDTQAVMRGSEAWRLSNEARDRVMMQRVANQLAHQLQDNADFRAMVLREAVDADGNPVRPGTSAKNTAEFRVSLRLLVIPLYPENPDA